MLGLFCFVFLMISLHDEKGQGYTPQKKAEGASCFFHVNDFVNHGVVSGRERDVSYLIQVSFTYVQNKLFPEILLIKTQISSYPLS